MHAVRYMQAYEEVTSNFKLIQTMWGLTICKQTDRRVVGSCCRVSVPSRWDAVDDVGRTARSHQQQSPQPRSAATDDLPRSR